MMVSSVPFSWTETGFVPAAFAVIFPNSPCASPFGPAAK
jgi:hypothetical protein